MHYSKSFKMLVAKEACKPEHENLEHILAHKYGIRADTVLRWRDEYIKYGERAFSKKRNPDLRTEREKELEKRVKELELENEILKKAAAFLANVGRS